MSIFRFLQLISWGMSYAKKITNHANKYASHTGNTQGSFTKYVTACCKWHSTIQPWISPCNGNVYIIRVILQPWVGTISMLYHHTISFRITSLLKTWSNVEIYWLIQFLHRKDVTLVDIHNQLEEVNKECVMPQKHNVILCSAACSFTRERTCNITVSTVA